MADPRIRTAHLLALLQLRVPLQTIVKTPNTIWVHSGYPLVAIRRSGDGWLVIVLGNELTLDEWSELDREQAEKRATQRRFRTVAEAEALVDELWPEDFEVYQRDAAARGRAGLQLLVEDLTGDEAAELGRVRAAMHDAMRDASPEAPPIEPGWYMVLSTEVGVVQTWGPRVAGPRDLSWVVPAIRQWAGLRRDDLAALRGLASGTAFARDSKAGAAWLARSHRCEGLVTLSGHGMTITVTLTDDGRAILALADALEGEER